MKNIAKVLLVALVFTGILSTAQAVYTAPAIQISELIVTPNPIDFSNHPSISIGYRTNAEAYVTLVINNGSKKVGTFMNRQLMGIGPHTYYWNGKYGGDTEIATSGEGVVNGTYSFTLTAVNSGQVAVGAATEAVKTGTITVSSSTTPVTPATSNLEIQNVDVDNPIFDPWQSETSEITFELSADADVTMEIFDDGGDSVKQLKDEESYSEGKHSVTWNGKDAHGDIVADGEYTYKINASAGSKHDDVEGNITVEKDYAGNNNASDDPNIENAYITKESFDPEWEYTYIIFNLTERADVNVSIYTKSSQIVEVLHDEENQDKGLYKVKFDGTNFNEDEYRYKISVENGEGKDYFTGDVEVKADDKVGRNPNIYKDKIDIDTIPYVGGEDLTISMKLDDDAEVTAEIRHDNKLVKEILDEEEMTEGTNTIKWDGKDKKGNPVEDGIYEYKITAQNSHGTDTERGNFSVAKTSTSTDDKCAGFTDITKTYKFCESITWAKEAGAFSGYDDDTFRPYQPIRRSEILKVIMEAFSVNPIGTNSSTLGFNDVSGHEWFKSYLATALSMRVVTGYSDGTFRPNDQVKRVEALKILLETGKGKYGLSIPNNNSNQPYHDVLSGKWYTKYAWVAKNNELTEGTTYFYPLDPMTRGEMADMLYRFHQAGLDE
ncbi:MAG: FlgD immunoglobulin-like domain containing protein [Candidatus Gracilibacteria bacterium]|jgi:flagellar hook assembly protein FlgD